MPLMKPLMNLITFQGENRKNMTTHVINQREDITSPASGYYHRRVIIHMPESIITPSAP
ncbi:hypothetical protein DPMN_111969 [Dreissena polymorpha]|uniref:Uncharacterized protein n=1 Tax=Dreissena polymorpha TaxID=45954 RepID=A0A9D4QPB5_DREPO|nr:hypothetical protein DPMN_111969 [Dreissena polymorpha]